MNPTYYLKNTGDRIAIISIKHEITVHMLIDVLAQEACIYGLDNLNGLTKKRAEEIIRRRLQYVGEDSIGSGEYEHEDHIPVVKAHVRRLWPEWFEKVIR